MNDIKIVDHITIFSNQDVQSYVIATLVCSSWRNDEFILQVKSEHPLLCPAFNIVFIVQFTYNHCS